jgi:phytoene dehydrogenase-like protein
MRKRIENAYGNVLTSTFKVVNPIKKSIINTDCEVHIFIQSNALEILKNEGYYREYIFFKDYLTQINKGLVWADQDFKSYHHFYNIKEERGKFGYDENALTVINRYYNIHSLVYIMRSLAANDAGMVEGGARNLAFNIAKTFTSKGGKIIYNSEIDHIYVEDNKAKGIVLKDNNVIESDYVISACDAHHTIYNLLQGKASFLP